MGDIIDTIEAAGTLGKLVTALRATGLTEMLRGAGPFTVFTPPDEGFSKLAPGTFDALLTDLPKLKTILTGHIVSGKLMAEDIMKVDSLQAIDGQRLTVKHAGALTVNDAKVVQADVNCSNGIIHIIDSVLLPQ